MEEEKQVAVVTGAGRGIGRAICIELARRGFHVVVNYGHQKEAAEEVVQKCRQFGVQAVAVKADMSQKADCDFLMKEALKLTGKVQVWVNNAGITRDNLLLRMSEEEFQKVIDLNLTGAFYGMKAAVSVMIRQRYGRIVTISSIAGVRGNAGQVNYSASKAGVIGMTKSLAKEVASRNITVNAIAPGMIATEMVDAIPDKTREEMVKSIPMRRMGEPKDVANAVAFLAGEDAGYITGQVLCVDGGMAV
ncbi:MAG: 3-oxoacyl-[acyl-carrier-protein] reductase [Roseburia sp.]|uniref:3-oxoacyl-[acyl-carrier-protein] reductase n=1 Tax=Roseburia sp. 831b TaxID=1261635 RepID=UPI0009510143|nr:3-oxoacyl-[acyl-carrier-protein] reductase [Roseburia sp. 831b]MCI5919602.1 3-oxoacyl-[acyl-carrier-protein] reductase [Roseburia sp.]MDD6217280.1 3-oxoacyl-[acyl-carrier-protein] reductase [Roseburia sp.]MDY5883428.1 3-oxoacyl-[acyl-carrier-protein] reductase [Roseburia sp.]WVK73666.1 3-oxoacyl-[acyl-carrier-protein] reductase [Roseburia sp. 831b]